MWFYIQLKVKITTWSTIYTRLSFTHDANLVTVIHAGWDADFTLGCAADQPASPASMARVLDYFSATVTSGAGLYLHH